MQESYLGSLWRFAVRGFVFKNDTMQIILASMLPAAYLWSGKPMPDGETSKVLAYFGMTTVTFVAVRFIVAPYFVWKEQNQKIKTLEAALMEPSLKLAEKSAEYVFSRKIELAKLIGLMLDESLKYWRSVGGGPSSDIGTFLVAKKHAGQIVTEFSYEKELYTDVIDFIQACSLVIRDTQEGTPNSDGRGKIHELGQKILKVLHCP